MATLESLITPMTFAEAQKVILDALTARGVDVTVWEAGSPLRTLVAACAVILSGLSALQANLAKSGFLRLSRSAWLTVLARETYGIDREVPPLNGTFASGNIVLTNSAGGVFNPAAFAVTVSRSGKLYRNTVAFSLAAFGTATVNFQAVEVGSASSAPASTITNLVTPLPGVSVTNPAAFVGVDQLSDADLIVLCGDKLGSLSPFGPKDAYAYAARTAVSPVTKVLVGVNRVQLIADGIGGVDAYVATAGGPVTGTVGDLTTDLGVVDDAMQRLAAPLVITLRTHPSDFGTGPVPVTYELWIYDRNTRLDADIKNDVALALGAYVSIKPSGGDVIPPATGFIYASGLESVIGAAVVDTVRVVVSSGDVAIDAHQAPVLGTVIVTAIHRIAGAPI